METNTTTRPTVAATALRYGLLTGIVAILYSFVLIVSQQLTNRWLGLLTIVISIGGIVLAMRDFRARNGGYMSYGEGMGIGVLLSLVSGVLSSTFSLLYRLVDPGMMQQVTEQMRAKLEEGGNLSDEQIDQAVAMSQKFSSGPIGFVVGVVGAVVVGAILSLVISAILKNSKPEFE